MINVDIWTHCQHAEEAQSSVAKDVANQAQFIQAHHIAKNTDGVGGQSVGDMVSLVRAGWS